MEVLLSVLTVGMDVVKEKEDKFSQVWPLLATTLDEFLFPATEPPQDRSPEDSLNDESMDCTIIEFLKEQVRPSSRNCS